MKRPLRAFLAAAFTIAAASGVSSADPIDLRVDRFADKINLGLSEFDSSGRDAAPAQLRAFSETLKKDLIFSRLFNIVDKGPMVKGKTTAVEWAKFGSQMVLAGEIKGRSGSRFEVEGRIYDTGNGDIAFRFEEKSEEGLTRELAHRVANQVVTYVTGEPGIFLSKIAFVNDSTGRKELYVADYDGEGLKRLTNDNSIVILPRISPDGGKIIFTSYLSGNPDLYFINTDGSGRRKISSQTGLNVSPSWSPNSREFAVTLSKDGPPNIYLMDLQGRVLKRLTDSRGADTAPAFSPDGRQIAFTSDRPGSPHIYVIGLDGTGLRRLTTDGHCDSAAWSPDGQTIVYVKGKTGNRFDIYSIEVLTGIERRLTWSEGDNENPSWSPDSRSILFTSTRRGKPELFMMGADGSDPTPLGAPPKGSSFTPHWSVSR